MSNVEIDEVKNYLCDIGRPTGLCFKQNRAYNLDPDMMDRLAEIVLEQAAEIERLQALVNAAKEYDEAGPDAAWEAPHPIFAMAEENDRLRTLADERGRRISIIDLYMGKDNKRNLCADYPEATKWFDAEGNAK